MNILLWVLQVLFGLNFFFIGVIHFIIPPGLPGPMSWMYELSPALHTFSGTAEILGGLGLILPGLTKIKTKLTSWAGLGLVLVMLGAIIWHLQRGEIVNIFINIVMASLVGFIAYGRWKLSPLAEK